MGRVADQRGDMTVSSTAATLDAVSDRPLRSTTARCRILALSLPAAAILLVIGEATFPKGLDNPATNLSTAAKEVGIAGAHPNQFWLPACSSSSASPSWAFPFRVWRRWYAAEGQCWRRLSPCWAGSQPSAA